MSTPKKDPNPIEDVRKGLGLLFRAARTAVQKLPTDKLEEAVMSGAKEVGRAMESVAHTIEKEVTKRAAPSASPPTAATASRPPDATDAAAEAKGAHDDDGPHASTPPPEPPQK